MGLTHPGGDPGSEAADRPDWQRILEKLFLPAGVADWRVAVEIGGGAGGCTDSVLRAAPDCRLFGFEIGEDAAMRPDDGPASGRISRHAMQRADGVVAVLADHGLAGQVDAVFSLDAMAQVDLTDLAACWMNAALVLKPGGRLLMTLADPTTPSGFQKILRDLRRLHAMQGRACARFEYVSADLVRSVLSRLGFAIEVLEPWSAHVGRPPRDLCLIARLDRPDLAVPCLAALRAGPEPAAPAGESYAELWTRQAARAIAGHPGRPSAERVLARLFAEAELPAWRQAVEIGIGDGRYAEAVLQANRSVRLTAVDVSEPVMQAAAARLALHLAEGRIGFLKVDPQAPDGILAAFERQHLEREVDAVFSIDAMQQIDLQYLLAYWLNAALVLRPGGWLIVNLADATTQAGFERLVAEAGRFFPCRGQASLRFEFQSFGLVRPLLERLGFDVTYAGHWNPLDGGEAGRDLFVVAQMVRPEAADALRGHLGIAPGAVHPTGEEEEEQDSRNAPDRAEPAAGGIAAAEAAALARALGRAYCRQLQRQANPGLSLSKVEEQARELWAGNWRAYSRLGESVLRDLAASGIRLHYVQPAPGDEPRADDPALGPDDSDDSSNQDG